jgi:single-stranded-DNA-specific exonuclease
VVGVVASRLSHDLNRPCIVLGGEGEFAKGSGRSIEGVNLVEALASCKGLLKSWGGHPMATGVSLEPKNLEEFRTAFNAAVEKVLGGQDPEKILNLTAILQPSEITQDFLKDIDQLYPYGIENPVPIFALEKVVLNSPIDIFGEKHFRFQLPIGDGRSIWGVAWNKASRIPPLGQPIDVAFELSWNIWRGRKNMQCTLIDWR